MLSQEAFLQSAAVNSIHDGLHEIGERRPQALEFFIVGVFQQRLVQVSDKMNQAFLLNAWDAIVRRIKIGHENAGEILEQSLDRRPLAGRRVDISDILRARKHPDEATMSPDAYSMPVSSTLSSGPLHSFFTRLS